MNVKVTLKYFLFTLLVSFLVTSCAPLIGPYSPKAYEYATSLKAETLALMAKAQEPYDDHKDEIEDLAVELDKAYEYVKGIPSNSISATQWKILRDPDGKLVGKFLKRWKDANDGTLNKDYIEQMSGVVADAFDEIICLEANKKKTSECKPTEGE